MSNLDSTLANHSTDRDWSWQEHAACRGEDIDLFFSPEGEREPERSNREHKAVAICRRCPVIAECAAYALDNRVHYGVYGGMTADERAAERRRRTRRKPEQRRDGAS